MHLYFELILLLSPYALLLNLIYDIGFDWVLIVYFKHLMVDIIVN